MQFKEPSKKKKKNLDPSRKISGKPRTFSFHGPEFGSHLQKYKTTRLSYSCRRLPSSWWRTAVGERVCSERQRFLWLSRSTGCGFPACIHSCKQRTVHTLSSISYSNSYIVRKLWSLKLWTPNFKLRKMFFFFFLSFCR